MPRDASMTMTRFGSALAMARKPLPHPFVEVNVLLLEAGLVAAAGVGARQPVLHRNIEEQRQVGHEIAGDQLVQFGERRQGHAARRSP